VAPQITDPVRNVIHRAAISNMRAYTPVYGSRGSVSYVTGSHAIKVGYTLIMGEYEQTALRWATRQSWPSTVPAPSPIGTPILAVNRVAQPRALRSGSVDRQSHHPERRPPPRLLQQ
jgi:hypothetical protein